MCPALLVSMHPSGATTAGAPMAALSVRLKGGAMGVPPIARAMERVTDSWRANVARGARPRTVALTED